MPVDAAPPATGLGIPEAVLVGQPFEIRFVAPPRHERWWIFASTAEGNTCPPVLGGDCLGLASPLLRLAEGRVSGGFWTRHLATARQPGQLFLQVATARPGARPQLAEVRSIWQLEPTADHDLDGLDNAADLACCDALRADADADGIADPDELALGTLPRDPDTDDDDLSDSEELALGTSPALFDTDGDGFADGLERLWATDPLVGDEHLCPNGLPVQPAWDLDLDCLWDVYESGWLTDMLDPDSDDDGLLDGVEVDTYVGAPYAWDDCLPWGAETCDEGFDPIAPDPNGDGLALGPCRAEPYPQQFFTQYPGDWLHTDPLQADSDHDGCRDDADPYPLSWDADRDTLHDCEELQLGTDPSRADADNDDFDDHQEIFIYGTDPNHRDTDRDGVEDGVEILLALDPLGPDSDGDGLGDRAELHTHRTDPLSPDSDGGGALDAAEVLAGGDPRDPADDGGGVGTPYQPERSLSLDAIYTHGGAWLVFSPSNLISVRNRGAHHLFAAGGWEIRVQRWTRAGAFVEERAVALRGDELIGPGGAAILKDITDDSYHFTCDPAGGDLYYLLSDYCPNNCTQGLLFDPTGDTVPGAVRLVVHGEVIDQFGVWDQPTLGTPWELDPQLGHDAIRASTAAQPSPDLAEWTFQR